MAKRAPVDEQPYRPLLDSSLVLSAVSPSSTPKVAKIVDLPRQAEVAQQEQRPASSARTEAPIRQVPEPVTLTFDQQKRILFTRAESQSIDRLVTAIASRLNTPFKVSNLMRALTTLVLHAESEVDRRAGELGALVRPANGDIQGIQDFERQVAMVLANAIRDAGPLR